MVYLLNNHIVNTVESLLPDIFVFHKSKNACHGFIESLKRMELEHALRITGNPANLRGLDVFFAGVDGISSSHDFWDPMILRVSLFPIRFPGILGWSTQDARIQDAQEPQGFIALWRIHHNKPWTSWAPIPSMCGIFTYIWLISMLNVGKYTIHGWYREGFSSCAPSWL